MIDAALKALAEGFAVFPCNEGAKTPATRHGFKEATLGETQVRIWWTKNPYYNVGVATGASNLFVVDIDESEPALIKAAVAGITAKVGRIPATRMVRTPRGGLHLYYRGHYGIPSSVKSLYPNVDVRAAGGYILYPGSRTEAGTYIDLPLPGCVGPVETVATPAGLLAACAPLPPLAKIDRKEIPSGTRLEKYAKAALEGEFKTVADCGEGSRNGTLNRSAFVIGQLVAGGALTEELAYETLMSAADSCGLESWEADRTIRSGFLAGSRNPRGNA